jgi:hypothetical protein
MFIQRAPSWICVLAAFYLLAFSFNARQEVLGPAVR